MRHLRGFLGMQVVSRGGAQERRRDGVDAEERAELLPAVAFGDIDDEQYAGIYE